MQFADQIHHPPHHTTPHHTTPHHTTQVEGLEKELSEAPEGSDLSNGARKRLEQAREEGYKEEEKQYTGVMDVFPTTATEYTQGLRKSLLDAIDSTNEVLLQTVGWGQPNSVDVKSAVKNPLSLSIASDASAAAAAKEKAAAEKAAKDEIAAKKQPGPQKRGSNFGFGDAYGTSAYDD